MVVVQTVCLPASQQQHRPFEMCVILAQEEEKEEYNLFSKPACTNKGSPNFIDRLSISAASPSLLPGTSDDISSYSC